MDLMGGLDKMEKSQVIIKLEWNIMSQLIVFILKISFRRLSTYFEQKIECPKEYILKIIYGEVTIGVPEIA